MEVNRARKQFFTTHRMGERSLSGKVLATRRTISRKMRLALKIGTAEFPYANEEAEPQQRQKVPRASTQVRTEFIPLGHGDAA